MFVLSKSDFFFFQENDTLRVSLEIVYICQQLKLIRSIFVLRSLTLSRTNIFIYYTLSFVESVLSLSDGRSCF